MIGRRWSLAVSQPLGLGPGGGHAEEKRVPGQRDAVVWLTGRAWMCCAMAQGFMQVR